MCFLYFSLIFDSCSPISNHSSILLSGQYCLQDFKYRLTKTFEYSPFFACSNIVALKSVAKAVDLYNKFLSFKTIAMVYTSSPLEQPACQKSKLDFNCNWGNTSSFSLIHISGFLNNSVKFTVKSSIY